MNMNNMKTLTMLTLAGLATVGLGWTALARSDAEVPAATRGALALSDAFLYRLMRAVILGIT